MRRTVAAKPSTAGRVVTAQSRSVTLRTLDRQTRALVGKPSREAFKLLDSGKFQGTIAEVHLKMLRRLSA